MIWQDAAFACGSLVFVAALVPMVRAKNPPPVRSSLSTGLVLGLFTACYWTLGGFALATVTTAATSLLWLELARQGFALRRKRPRDGFHPRGEDPPQRAGEEPGGPPSRAFDGTLLQRPEL